MPLAMACSAKTLATEGAGEDMSTAAWLGGGVGSAYGERIHGRIPGSSKREDGEEGESVWVDDGQMGGSTPKTHASHKDARGWAQVEPGGRGGENGKRVSSKETWKIHLHAVGGNIISS